MNIALYFAGFLVFLFLFRYIAFFLALRNVRIKKGTCTFREPSELPAYLVDFFNGDEQNLFNLGFIFSHYRLENSIFLSQSEEKWIKIYFHPEQCAYAHLFVSTVSKSRQCSIEFQTLFSDGHVLYTFNGVAHAMVGKMPNTTVVDPYAPTVEKQWEAHLAALRELVRDKSPVELSAHEYTDFGRRYMEATVDKWISDGVLCPVGENLWRITLLACVDRARTFVAGEKKAKALQKRTLQASTQSPLTSTSPVPVEVEIGRFKQLTTIAERRPSGWIGKILILIVTATLFTLAFGFTLSPEFIGILIVVLLIHELGHMLGMYMFNYKDLKILFLPFLGAATFGVNRTALAHQKVLIYLLGPGPGLIIGTGFMMAYWNTHMKLFLEIGVVFLSVNMINLLPVMPLDGGQLFNLVLFQRYTFLQTGFLLFSALVAATAGLALKDPILFFLAFFITISVPAQIRNNRALSTLRPRLNNRPEILSEDSLLQKIFTLLNTQPFHRLPFPKKMQTAKYLMENAQTNPPPRRTIFLSLLLYILVILSPLWVLAAVGFVMGTVKAVSFSFNA